jgi:hypothetical protein
MYADVHWLYEALSFLIMKIYKLKYKYLVAFLPMYWLNYISFDRFPLFNKSITRKL